MMTLIAEAEDKDAMEVLRSWIFDKQGKLPAPQLTVQVIAVEGSGDRAVVRAKISPLDMLIFCPSCGNQHVDGPDKTRDWANPPHRSHLCAYCGLVWRHADVPTNGVLSIETHGTHDGDPKPRRWKP